MLAVRQPRRDGIGRASTRAADTTTGSHFPATTVDILGDDIHVTSRKNLVILTADVTEHFPDIGIIAQHASPRAGNRHIVIRSRIPERIARAAVVTQHATPRPSQRHAVIRSRIGESVPGARIIANHERVRGRKRGTVKPLILGQLDPGVIIVRVNIEPDALGGVLLLGIGLVHLLARLVQSVDENLDLSVSQPTVTKLLLDGIQLRASLILGKNIDLGLRQTEPLGQSRSVLDLARSVILGFQKKNQILLARTTHERLHGTDQLAETRYITILNKIKDDFLLPFGQLKLVDIILNLTLHRIHIRQIEIRGHVVGNKTHLVGERGGGLG